MEHLTRAELLNLLRVAKTHRERDWLMILVAYWHGMRASEVVGLKRDQIRDGFLTVSRLKGSLRTTHPLVKDVDELLNEHAALSKYVLKFPNSARIFKVSRQHFWRLIQAYASQAGIPAHKRHPHILKHSIAMHSIESAGIQNVRQYQGHKSISSTGEYLKVSDQDAAKAVQNVSRK